MNGNQVVAALNAENRRLREHIVQMQKDVGQGKFMEDLVCAAVTGLSSHTGVNKLEPEDIASVSLRIAESVLHQIVSNIAEAESAQPDESPQEDKGPKIVAP